MKEARDQDEMYYQQYYSIVRFVLEVLGYQSGSACVLSQLDKVFDI
jgi:hypothetical protein